MCPRVNPAGFPNPSSVSPPRSLLRASSGRRLLPTVSEDFLQAISDHVAAWARGAGRWVPCWVPDTQAQWAPRNHLASSDVHETDCGFPGGAQVSCLGPLRGLGQNVRVCWTAQAVDMRGLTMGHGWASGDTGWGNTCPGPLAKLQAGPGRGPCAQSCQPSQGEGVLHCELRVDSADWPAPCAACLTLPPLLPGLSRGFCPGPGRRVVTAAGALAMGREEAARLSERQESEVTGLWTQMVRSCPASGQTPVTPRGTRGHSSTCPAPAAQRSTLTGHSPHSPLPPSRVPNPQLPSGTGP